jgi:hypothetical protein
MASTGTGGPSPRSWAVSALRFSRGAYVGGPQAFTAPFGLVSPAQMYALDVWRYDLRLWIAGLFEGLTAGSYVPHVELRTALLGTVMTIPTVASRALARTRRSGCPTASGLAVFRGRWTSGMAMSGQTRQSGSGSAPSFQTLHVFRACGTILSFTTREKPCR